MSDEPKHYRGEKVDVMWNRHLCIHVAECGRANNEMFESGRKPWCNPDLVDAEEAIDVVERCPSGALWYDAKESEGETPDERNTVTVANNGPLYVRGELQFENREVPLSGVKFRAALCRCGKSKNKPFCDNSHEAAGFADRGAIGDRGPGLEEQGGRLDIKVRPDGPLLLRGNVELIASSGRVAWRGTNCALCRCGESKNKPFCDGSHKAAGFRDPETESES